MADVARESAAVLLALAQAAANAKWCDKLVRSGTLFKKLAANCALRAEIYRQKQPKKKFVSLIRLIASRGYFGSAFSSMGMSSFLKDLVSCFFGRAAAS
jgi:hypothetical protein